MSGRAKALLVVEKATGEVVERIPLDGVQDEEVRRGLRMQMNTADYRIEEEG